MPLYPCPCCGFATLRELGAFDCCPVCWWEDDGQDNHDADKVRGGPNSNLTLTQARANFLKLGIFDPTREDLKKVQKDRSLFAQARSFRIDANGEVVETKSSWH